jgi:hypothetical protein
MDLPLTPDDQASLRAWLMEQLSIGHSPLEVLRLALETPVEELIPTPDQPLTDITHALSPCSVQELVMEICRPHDETLLPAIQALAGELALHLMPPRDLVFLTHYFVRNWLPRLGSGPGWFLALIRDRGYINRRTGELRDQVSFQGGYGEVARLLGLARVKTIWEWLRKEELQRFVSETGKGQGGWEDAPRTFKVSLNEPLTPEDGQIAEHRLREIPIGGSVTHGAGQQPNTIGAPDTLSGAPVIHRLPTPTPLNGGSGTHDTASDTLGVGAPGNLPGATDTHTSGASDTLNGGTVTPAWREWHHLITSKPGTKPEPKTVTTHPTSNDGESSPGQAVGVGADWNLEQLMSLNRVNPRNHQALLEEGASAGAFVSWLLYAAGERGQGIRDAIAHTVSRLLRNPAQGAGGAYDRLAAMPAQDLARLVELELGFRNPGNRDWRSLVDGVPRSRLVALANQLGIDIPDLHEW